MPDGGLDRNPVSQQGWVGEKEFVLNHPDRRSRAGKERDKLRESPPASSGAPDQDGEPGWASGLRQLYNSVVEEPLPDSFKDLLKKLDDSGNA